MDVIHISYSPFVLDIDITSQITGCQKLQSEARAAQLLAVRVHLLCWAWLFTRMTASDESKPLLLRSSQARIMKWRDETFGLAF